MDQASPTLTAAKATHPLILVAAGAVTIASLAAAAHFTGLLPGATVPTATPPAAVASAPQAVATSTPAPQLAAPSVAPAEPAKPAAKPAPRPTVSHHSAPRHADSGPEDRRLESANAGATRRVAHAPVNDPGIDLYPAAPTQAPQTSVPPQAICHECGTVESIREIASEGGNGVIGTVAGGVLGGVLGHQVGRGTGKDLATIAGAIGGAFAGRQVEKNVRSDRQYQVTVRFDDGAMRTYTLTNPQWHTGDRVRSANGQLAPI